MHWWNIFLIEALSMHARFATVKTVKLHDKKPGISDRSSFLRRRKVKFQFVWQKRCYDINAYHCMKQIDSMLPWVYLIIDHRWRQNVIKTMKWHTGRRRVCHWCFYHILTSSVIYYWTGPRQHGIYFFIQWSEKEKDRCTYLPRTAWLFEDLC